MIVKRNEHNDEEVIVLENGCRFHYLYNFDSLDNMKEKLEEARTAFKNNPSQINRLDMIYQAADYMWAKGEHQEAAEYLKQEIDGTGEVVGAPDSTVNFQENDGLMITGHICALDRGRRATQMSLISLAQETSSGLLETSNFSSSFFLYQRMVSLLRERASAI